MGVYSLVQDITTGGKAVYKNSTNAQYMYFWPKSKAWLIGIDYNTDGCGVKSKDGEDARSPELASSWSQYNKKWAPTASIAVTCVRLSFEHLDAISRAPYLKSLIMRNCELGPKAIAALSSTWSTAGLEVVDISKNLISGTKYNRTSPTG